MPVWGEALTAEKTPCGMNSCVLWPGKWGGGEARSSDRHLSFCFPTQSRWECQNPGGREGVGQVRDKARGTGMCAPSPLRTLGTSSVGDGGWPPAEREGTEEAALQLPTAGGGGATGGARSSHMSLGAQTVAELGCRGRHEKGRSNPIAVGCDCLSEVLLPSQN